MNVWLKVQVLLVLFCLSSSAPTPEECQRLLEPLPLDGPSTMFGNWTFITGYNSYELYKDLLKITQISKMEIKAGSNSNEVIMVQENKMNGTCLGSTSTVVFNGNTATVTVSNITSSFQMLPTCNGCMVFNIKSTASTSAINKVLQAMRHTQKASGEEVTATALYLFSQDSTVGESDQEQFTKQAKCLGYTQEPDFHYDPKEGYCSKDEIIPLQMK